MSTTPRLDQEVDPKPWQTGLAPVYIGTFLWIAFFDQLGRRALPIGGLAWSMLGVAVGGPLSYLLLFRASGLWGHQVGKPSGVVSTGTFGIQGAKLVPGLLLGLVQVLLFALAVGYAIELTFQGLVLLGFVDPASLRPTRVGTATLKSPLFLITALIWAVATALISLGFTRWIAYLMQYFPIFPALAIGGAMLAMLVGLRSFRPTGIDPLWPSVVLPEGEARLRAFLLTLQWTFAFSTLGGVMAADWGSGSLTSKDVKVGGWVGTAFAPVIIAALALISVAGYQGTREESRLLETPGSNRSTIRDLTPAAPGLPAGLEAPSFTFRAVANGGFGRYVGGVILVVFGLSSLAPAIYAGFSFAGQFKSIGPGLPQVAWSIMGTFTAWLIIVGGWFDRTEVAFNFLGALLAPVAGAILADYRRHKGRWPGPREGVNPAGLIAWVVGLAVGLTPTIARVFHYDRIANLQPAALGAFLAAYFTYELLALARLESNASPHGWAVSETE